MAVTFAGAGSTETLPGGCECASRAGEGERGATNSPGRCQFILMAFDDVMTPEVLSGSHKLC